VTAVILAHLAAVLMWSWPTATLKNPFLRLLEPYLRSTGLAQSWGMFAGVWKQNFYVEYTIAYRDGTERHLFLPWKERSGSPWDWEQSYQAHFAVKWVEALCTLEDKRKQPVLHDNARFLARIFATDPSNPPAAISLTCWWMETPPPGQPMPDPTWHRTDHVYRIE